MGPDGRRHCLTLAFSDAGCLRGIRGWLRGVLEDDDTGIDAELVCTELVSNAIEHGGGAGTLRVVVTAGRHLAIEVDDRSHATDLTVGRSRLGGRRGRGLLIVEAAATWGVRPTSTGKTVWAHLR